MRACGARCQEEWKLQAASANGHKLPCSFLPRGSCTRMRRRHTYTHSLTPARKHAKASTTQSTPHPSANSPPRPARPAQQEPTLHTFKSQSGRKLPPASPLSESHEMQKGRATGGPPPSPGRAHRPLGQSCEQPRRCQPAHSGSRARRGERTIVAAAALGGGGAAAEAARRVPGPCPQLPAAAAAEIWLSYYSPPSTGCECVCARV